MAAGASYSYAPMAQLPVSGGTDLFHSQAAL